jgi:hypothetical protein
MTPALRAATWSATAAVGVTGLVYGFMAYCLPESPMDVVNHPWQPTMLHLHVLAAPMWLVVLGAVWYAHVLPKLREPARRRSGLALVALAVVMAGSAYLLQTAVEPSVRSLWKVTHVATSLAWLLVLAAHVLSRLPRGADAEPPARRSDRPHAATAADPIARRGSHNTATADNSAQPMRHRAEPTQGQGAQHRRDMLPPPTEVLRDCV